MKTVTVHEASVNFTSLLRLVAAGEEIQVVRRKKPVARILPVHSQGRIDWSSTWKRVDAVFGGKPAPGKAGSRIIREGRR